MTHPHLNHFMQRGIHYMIFSMRCGADLIPQHLYVRFSQPLYCQWSTLSKFKNTCNRPLSWTFSCTRSTRYSEGRMQSGPFCWWPTAYSLVRFAEGWPHTIWSLLLRAKRIQFDPFCWGLTAYNFIRFAEDLPHTVRPVMLRADRIQSAWFCPKTEFKSHIEHD